ncbi:hypothetical protein K456DRAFT_1079333 [Colletotrichum gloeosporioides 23]|nr:hypothetical protein K456DRAFT_1079333 [Colletotrichum gloeosporioides 23]
MMKSRPEQLLVLRSAHTIVGEEEEDDAATLFWEEGDWRKARLSTRVAEWLLFVVAIRKVSGGGRRGERRR